MTLKLNGSSSGYAAIDAPASAGSNTLVLPTSNGSANQVLKTDGSGNLAWVDQVTVLDNTPAFSVHLSADQDVDHDTATKIVFNAEQFDSDSAYNTSDGLFTVPSGKGGKYKVSAQAAFDDIDSGSVEYAVIYPYVDGSQLSDYRQSGAVYGTVTGHIAGPSYSHIIQLNAGQTLAIYAYHTNGATLHLQHEWTFFSAFRLAGV